eukprot:GHVO01052008.1.p1 GENE.GHVO01052008.1~~GHVO01052008.1.p1  ORF type:complete len:998 (+),score=178.77 GHVO01052008.1:52-3045(+)
MSKARMSALDIAAMVRDISGSIRGLKVVNVYDVNQKIYLLKLYSKNVKYVLLMEAGIRFHLTEFQRSKSSIPSNFSMKLRKHMRNRWISNIQQVGFDRVIDIQFGIGEKASHLIVEFYVAGNLILTDSKYKVLTILRPHGGGGLLHAVGSVYDIDGVRESSSGFLLPYLPLSNESTFIRESCDSILSEIQNLIDAPPAENEKKKPKWNYRTLVSKLVPFAPPALILHTLTDAKKVVEIPNEDDAKTIAEALFRIHHIMAGFNDTSRLPSDLNASDVLDDDDDQSDDELKGKDTDTAVHNGIPGWIVYKEESIDNYTPLLFSQHNDLKVKEFGSFSGCCDEFYGVIEAVQQEREVGAQKKQMLSKVEKIKVDQQRRADQLAQEQESADIKASCIENNLQLVDSILDLIREAVASGADWKQLWNHIRMEQRVGHPIATHIHALNFEKNEVVAILPPEGDEGDEGNEDCQMTPVPLDISATAYGNMEKLHSMRKVKKVKQQKTEDAAKKALSIAESKTAVILTKKSLQQDPFSTARKPLWFEKFHWFISSENYLIISGRDATQNERLFRRYLKTHDLFVHADVHGASTCIIKNRSTTPIPPSTLQEAGQMSICRSSAWEQKMIIGAYWVYPSQVSKTAPTGEYLTTGAFMIRGKKNFLPPLKLEMGLGLLFAVSDDCVEGHMNERLKRMNPDEIGAEGTGLNQTKYQQMPDDGIDPKGIPESDHQSNKDRISAKNDDSSPHENTPVLSPTHNDIVSDDDEHIEKNKPKKIISRAAKRKLKKGGTDGSIPEAPVNSDIPSSQPKAPVMSKYQKKKMEKMKKYEDQDEEERAIRMKLTGGKPLKIETDVPNDESPAPVERDYPPAPKKKPNQPMEMTEEDDVPVQLDVTDRLTPWPHEEDTILYTIAVCAPFVTVSKYTYKVKLTPGQTKKGKAVQDIFRMFTNQMQRDDLKNTLKRIPLEEVTHGLIKGVKVWGAANSLKGKMQQKSKRKELAKAIEKLES